MKKGMKIAVILISALLVVGLAGAGVYKWILDHPEEEETTANVSGVEWYSEDEKTFTISSVKELYELVKVSEYYDFKGQTVKLGADITINEGDAKEWGEKIPEKKWNPIINFAGTFDGQGHTISGMYCVGYYDIVGMFANTQRGCVIKNFKLVNSFFKNNGDKGTGSILGKGGGQIDTVYSNAYVQSNGWHTGGIVGMFSVSGTNKITNCWFDGALDMEGEYGRYGGGILGTVNVIGAMNRIEHCLNTANITTTATSNPVIGGICGAVMANGSLQLNDNLNVGKIDTKHGIYGIGSVLGRVIGKTTVAAIENNYAASESYNTALGGSEGKMTGSSTRIRTLNLIGYEGYQWTELDFKNYWAVAMDSTPVLQSFTETIVSLDGIKKKIDKSWYIENGKEFTLTTAAELFGLAELSRTIDFKNVTIKLGADIVCNEGKATQWAKNPPINMWKPIGYNAEFGGKTFNGTFDGQGHTISGLYGKTKSSMMALFGEVGTTGVVKNVKIKNSYFEAEKSKSTVWGMVASVAGKCWGTIDTVYSDAILVNNGTVTGGIVGMMRITGKDGGPCIIRNCWFDGVITANGSTGGILGDIYGCPTTVEHCLNTGKISTLKMSGNIGGLVGIVEIKDAKLKLTDSVNVGKIYDASKKSWNVGSAIGRVVKTAAVTNVTCTIQSVFVSKESSGNAIGNKTGNFIGEEILRLAEKDLIGTNGYFNTSLSFYSKGKGYWVAQEGKTPVLKSFARGKTLAVGGMRADISWYNKDKNVYTIKNASQLYGVRLLSDSTDFKGKTICLANDITVNAGDANAWKNSAPTYSWKPIGYNAEFGGKTFNGTFDGQGHTISGLYGKTKSSMLALFGEVGATGVVKNLRITNTYFEAVKSKADVWGMVASVAGKCWGTIDTVYSNATLVNNGSVTGGMVGMMRITGKTGKCIIRNCWYDGNMNSGYNSGGILGDIYGCETTIEHCLNTGTITTAKASGNVGGLCGIIEIKGGKLHLTDSLNVGTIKDLSGKSWNVGSALGRAVKIDKPASAAYETEAIFKNVYVAKESSGNAIGNATGKHTGNVVSLRTSDLTGDVSYLKTKLDFYVAKKNTSGKWVVKAGGTPVLRSFAGSGALDLTNALCADTSWYDEKKDSFTISSKAELYGLAELSKTTDFAGKTITLGADITVNEGDSTSWGTNAPKYTWTAIETFAGTFDGGMHTISGIYLKNSDVRTGLFRQVLGGTVKNLILTNSYFENTLSGGASELGSVVGRLNGIMDTVKSDATVVLNGSEYAGGLVGDITADGMGAVKNSWFAGTVTGKGSHHGTLVGGVRTANAMAILSDCLSTGKIDWRSNAGGLVGTLWDKTSKVTIENSLYAGNFVKAEGAVGGTNGVIVGNALNGIVAINNVYGVKEDLVTKMIGNNSTNAAEEGKVTQLDRTSQLCGEASFLNMNLDFFITGTNESGNWLAVDGHAPVQVAFGGNVAAVDLSQVLKADTSWYDESKDSFVIKTAGELLGFAKLSKTTNFAGKTITLGNDITINSGNAADWGTNAPKYPWTPVETFSGVFDGNSKTISGIYIKSSDARNGLFRQVKDGTVKNLILTNSYVENTATSGTIEVGSVVGRLNGILEAVKSDATLVLNGGEYAGGLVGDITSEGLGMINSCEFDGTVKGKGGHHAMILGGVRTTGAKGIVSNCFAKGSIELRPNTGGLVGSLWNSATLTLEDSVFAGKFTAVEGVSGSNNGTAIGNARNGVATIANVYVLAGSGMTTKVGNKGSNTDTGVTDMTQADLSDKEAVLLTNLKFIPDKESTDGYWVAIEKGMLELAAFSTKENMADLSGILKANTSWYDESKTEYVLKTTGEFLGFAELSKTTDFAGKTVKLGADIVINPGDAKEWGTTAPAFVWTPIGYSGMNTAGKAFAGTFDGQGHTISGIYIKSDKTQLGLFGKVLNGTVKNFTLTNSYIESAKASGTAAVGSIVGRLYGTVDTVKSEATVVTTGAEYIGGLVGDIIEAGPGTLTNSWFAGSVSGKGSHHGMLLGGVHRDGNKGTPTGTVTHCMATGKIDYRSNAGGLVGTLWTGSVLTMEDCLYAGDFVKLEGVSASNIGTVIANATNGSATVTNVIVRTDSMVGTKIGNKGSNKDTGVKVCTLAQLSGDNARTNTALTIYAVGKDSSSDGDHKTCWWLTTDSTPILESFKPAK